MMIQTKRLKLFKIIQNIQKYKSIQKKIKMCVSIQSIQSYRNKIYYFYIILKISKQMETTYSNIYPEQQREQQRNKNKFLCYFKISSWITFTTTIFIFVYGISIYIHSNNNIIVNIITCVYGIYTGMQLLLVVLTSMYHKSSDTALETFQLLNSDVINGSALLFSSWQYGFVTFMFLTSKNIYFCKPQLFTLNSNEIIIIVTGLMIYALHVISILVNYIAKYILIKSFMFLTNYTHISPYNPELSIDNKTKNQYPNICSDKGEFHGVRDNGNNNNNNNDDDNDIESNELCDDSSNVIIKHKKFRVAY